MTLREHLEAILDRHYRVQWIEPNNLGAEWGCSCGYDAFGNLDLRRWPCADYEDAVAALKALDEATKGEESHPGLEGFRLVPDRTQPNEKLETPPDPAPPTENT